MAEISQAKILLLPSAGARLAADECRLVKVEMVPLTLMQPSDSQLVPGVVRSPTEQTLMALRHEYSSL